MRFFTSFLLLVFALIPIACGGGGRKPDAVTVRIQNTSPEMTGGETDIAEIRVDTVLVGSLPAGSAMSVTVTASQAHTVTAFFSDGFIPSPVEVPSVGVPRWSEHLVVFHHVPGEPGPGPGPGPEPEEPTTILSVCNGYNFGIWQIYISAGTPSNTSAPSAPVWQAFYNGGGASDPNGQIAPGAQNDQLVPLGDGYYSVWIYFADGTNAYFPAVQLGDPDNDGTARVLSVAGSPPYQGTFGPCVRPTGPWTSSTGYPYFSPPTGG